MAWAMVTDGGTPYSRQPCWAPGTAALTNASGLMSGEVDGTVEPVQTGNVALTTKACEMKWPVLVRSHWVVVRTVPAIFWPATAQTSSPRRPGLSFSTTAAAVFGAVRM